MERSHQLWLLAALLAVVGSSIAAEDKAIPGFPSQFRRYKFVILVMEGPRIGSGFLQNLLNKCPALHLTHELLYEHRRNPKRSSLTCLKDWTSMLEERIRDDRGQHSRLQLLYLGMKTQWIDLEPVSEYVMSLRPRVIFLHRKNRVKQALSMCNAHKSGVYHSSSAKPKNTKFTCPVEEFTRLLNRFNSEAAHSWDAVYTSDMFIRNPYHLVTYEDLSADPIGVANRIFRFLGVQQHCHLSPSSLGGLYVKQVEDDLKSSVANFQELYDSLDGSPFQAQMLGADDFFLKGVGNETAT